MINDEHNPERIATPDAICSVLQSIKVNAFSSKLVTILTRAITEASAIGANFSDFQEVEYGLDGVSVRWARGSRELRLWADRQPRYLHSDTAFYERLCMEWRDHSQPFSWESIDPFNWTRPELIKDWLEWVHAA